MFLRYIFIDRKGQPSITAINAFFICVMLLDSFCLSLHNLSLFFLHSALCLVRLIYKDHINKAPMLSGLPLGLASESLGKRSEGRRRVRPECIFPWLLPRGTALGWTCPSTKDQCAFPGNLSHTSFFFLFPDLATAPAPHHLRSRCTITSFTAPSSGCCTTYLGCPTLPFSPTHTFINNPFANELS